MSVFEAQRIIYLRDTYTRGEIQSITGIHWKTQESLLAGTGEISLSQHNNLTKMYSRTVYGNLRNMGLSVSQSSRIRNWSPLSVYDVQIEIEGVLHTLAKDKTIERAAKKSLQGLDYDIDDIYESAYKGVKNRLSFSTKQYEDIIENPHDIT